MILPAYMNLFRSESLVIESSHSQAEIIASISSRLSRNLVLAREQGREIHGVLRGSVFNDRFRMTLSVRGINGLNPTGVGRIEQHGELSRVTVSVRYSHVDVAWFIAIASFGMLSGILLIAEIPILSLVLIVGFATMAIIVLKKSSEYFQLMRTLLEDMVCADNHNANQ